MEGYHDIRGGLSWSNLGGCGVTWRAIMSNMVWRVQSNVEGYL